MLLCSWVQPSTRDVHVGTKVDEFGFTLVNFKTLLLIQKQPFVFLSQVDQVFFSDEDIDPLHVLHEIEKALPREPIDGEHPRHTKQGPIEDYHEGKYPKHMGLHCLL